MTKFIQIQIHENLMDHGRAKAFYRRLRPVLILCVLFGYYFDLNVSYRVNWLTKLYCISLSFISCYIYVFYDRGPLIQKSLLTVEYVLSVYISLNYGKKIFKYLCNATRRHAIIDLPANYVKKFEILSFILVGTLIICRFLTAVFFRAVFHDTLSLELLFNISGVFVIHLHRDMVSGISVMLVMVLYHRAAALARLAARRGFGDAAPPYAALYYDVHDHFQQIEFSYKLQFIINVLWSNVMLFGRLHLSISNIIKSIRDYDHETRVQLWAILMALEVYYMCLSYAPLVAFELVAWRADALDALLAQWRLSAPDERWRSRVERLRLAARESPLRFRAWGAAPLGAPLLLAALAATAQYVISILQLIHFFD